MVLVATLAGFFTEGLTGIPTWLVAFTGAVTLIGIYGTAGKGRVGPILGGVSWDVILFVMGIFVVVLGLRKAGLTREVGQLSPGWRRRAQRS